MERVPKATTPKPQRWIFIEVMTMRQKMKQCHYLRDDHKQCAQIPRLGCIATMGHHQLGHNGEDTKQRVVILFDQHRQHGIALE